MPNSDEWHDSINRMEDEHNSKMWEEKGKATTRFNVDANCSHCEDVPTKCRKCGKEYPKQLLAKACEIRHPSEPEPKRWGTRLTVSEVAEMVGVKPATFRSYVSRGQAPKADGQYDGRTPFWFYATIVAWKRDTPLPTV